MKKQNLKNQLIILLLLIAMVASLSLGVILMVLDIFWVVKVIVVLLMIALSIFIFIMIKKTNKKLVYIEKKVIVETLEPKTTTNKILCPKCFNPYDGEICFVCGYNKNENNA